MIPLRDLFGFAVWVAGIFGDTVQWRDQRLKLHTDGQILTGWKTAEDKTNALK